MRYVSTRGQAPSRRLPRRRAGAACAPDGGLYVPEAWPPLRAARDRRLRRPALRRGRRRVAGRASPATSSIRRAALRDLRARPTPPSPTPAVTPLSQLGAEPLAARAVPRPRPGLQGRGDAAPGPALRPRRWAAQRPHADHRLRHLRRHRRRGGRGLPRPRRTSASWSLFPEGRISEVQRRFMTTAGERQRRLRRGRGHLRRLPGHREGGCSRDQALRQAVDLLGRQLDQLRPHRRPGGLLLHRRRGAGRAAPAGQLLRARGQLRRRLRRLCGRADGPADRAHRRWHQRQRHPGPRLRDRPLRARRGGRDQRPAMDIQSPSNFERLYFEARRPRARWRPRAPSRPSPRPAPSTSRRRRCAAMRELFTGVAVGEDETARTIVATLQRDRRADRPAHRRRRRGRAPRRADGAAPLIVLSTAHPGQVPGGRRGRDRRRARPARRAATSPTGAGAVRPPARRRRGHEGLRPRLRGGLSRAA